MSQLSANRLEIIQQNSETPGAALESNKRKGNEITDDAISCKVAKHYNEIEEKGLDKRKESRIYYMRNFNNWIKSMLIQEYADKIINMRPDLRKGKAFQNKRWNAEKIARRKETEGNLSSTFVVLDMGCGKGGDFMKWKKAEVDHLICVDIAENSIEQARKRYYDMKSKSGGNIFNAKFSCRDCTTEALPDLFPKINGKPPLFDIVSCQFAFHYAFESQAQAERLFKNAAECLRPGGYFIGTTIDSKIVWQRLKESSSKTGKNEGSKTNCMQFGNSIYSLEFDAYSPVVSTLKSGLLGSGDSIEPCGELPKSIPKFGNKYNFKLHGVVDCPEFLVDFDNLKDIAERNDMMLIAKQGFENYFKDKRKSNNGRSLLQTIKALEMYTPAKRENLVGGDIAGNYTAAEKYIEKLKMSPTINGTSLVEPDFEPAVRMGPVINEHIHIGTLSKEEWEAITLYCVFAFKKKSGSNIDKISGI